MKLSYSIENIRRIQNMPSIEIRPITILVGRNSAGKSTFLRSFPLIRQSLETRSSAPILWYGNLVDFGDFSSAVGSSSNREAKFNFEISNLDIRRSQPPIYYARRYGSARTAVRKLALKEIKNVEVCFVVGQEKNETKRTKVKLNILDSNTNTELIFSHGSESDTSFFVNGINIIEKFGEVDFFSTASNLFSAPSIGIWLEESSEGRDDFLQNEEIIHSYLFKVIRRAAGSRIKDVKINREVRRLLSEPTISLKQLLEFSELSSIPVTIQKLYSKAAKDPKDPVGEAIHFVKSVYLSMLVFRALEEQLSEFFKGVSYMGPARAAGERYYRKQELEVSEIASDGKNFPVFLASLPNSLQQEFSVWVEKLFGFGVTIGKYEGHISINLKSSNKLINVTDTGYGVSQMLPVLGAIWWSQRPKRSSNQGLRFKNGLPNTIVIEQPELHLHPAHQAKLADVFAHSITVDFTRDVRGINTSKLSTSSFIIETHSEALINRLGELIEEKKISPQDVQVVVFSASDDLISAPTISIAKFDKNGVLDNWPFGFFNYSQT